MATSGFGGWGLATAQTLPVISSAYFSQASKSAAVALASSSAGGFEETLYGPPWGGIQGTGTTATGINLHGSPHKLIVAVDPSVIPLGTRMTIPGYGEGVAADTGGAVQGAVIDLWFPTAAQAAAWGRRTVTITLH